MPAWYCLLRVTSSFIHYHSRIAVFLLACAQTAWAQAGRAELFGTVRDPAGLAVAGATAELSEANTGLRHAALTGDRGEYHFAALLPGAYSVTVRKDGFRTLERAGIERFTIGNASRNPVRGPGYPAADPMAGKLFHSRERLSAQIRAEAFNGSNTPPLGQPNGNFGAAAFGSITQAGDPRAFELAPRVKF